MPKHNCHRHCRINAFNTATCPDALMSDKALATDGKPHICAKYNMICKYCGNLRAWKRLFDGDKQVALPHICRPLV